MTILTPKPPRKEPIIECITNARITASNLEHLQIFKTVSPKSNNKKNLSKHYNAIQSAVQ
jgi:hypothetical protein